MQLWSEKLMDFIGALENALGKTAELSMMPMQPGGCKINLCRYEKTRRMGGL
jgi:hypothetical protein